MNAIKGGMTIFIIVSLLATCVFGTVSIPPVDEVRVDKANGAQPLYTGVPRTVMLEEFTFITCHFCHELAEGINGGTGLYGTVDTYGFDQIAPLWTHTSGGSDPMFILNPEPCVERFYNYYGSSANPYTWTDGTWHEDSEIDVPEDPEIHSWFDERLLIPANISIESYFFLSGNDGMVAISIEAVNDIDITDLTLQCAIWEDHIQIDPRFYDPGDPPAGSPPSGEFRFACWDFVPDPLGTPIWPNGAKKWDNLELAHNFSLDPAWNVDTSQLGMSIWIQSASSQLVEQAHVEDFGNFGNHKPWVEDNGFPSGQGEVLSGTETVTWFAFDHEDPNGSLDVALEYSPDFGSTWLVLENGTTNNDGTFTWDTTTVADGTDYIKRITATDSGGKSMTRTFWQPFSIDNTPDDEWFFQVDGPSNLDLGMLPCERNSTGIRTTITSQGQVLIGTWETVNAFTDTTLDFSDPWTFNVNGYTTNDGFDGFLYAKIFASSDLATPLNITGLDDESVGDYQTSHLFTWQDHFANLIPDGDRLIIELWLDVYAGKAPTFESYSYDFDAGSFGWTANHWARQNLNSPTWQTAGGNPSGWIGVDLWYAIGGPEPMPGCGAYWETVITPSGTPTNVMLDFDWICRQYGGSNLADLFFYVFIDHQAGTPVLGTEVWSTSVTSMTPWAHSGPLDVSADLTTASKHYLKFGVWEEVFSKQTLELAGYDNVAISWDTTESIFVMETDYSDTQSSVLPSLGSTYNVGPLDVGWNFISNPYSAPDFSLPDALVDLDGDTIWTSVQYFDSNDPVDPWKTWSSFKPPALNDLTGVRHEMGVWLFIPDAGSLGDGLIKLWGIEPVYCPINLKAGWNMVGYPADDDSTYDVNALIADTGATGVEGFNPIAPYRLEVVAGNYVLKNGEAYWVKVDSDTTWTVDW